MHREPQVHIMLMLPWASLLLGMLEGYMEYGGTITNKNLHATSWNKCATVPTWQTDLIQARTCHGSRLRAGFESLLGGVMPHPAAPASHSWQQQHTAGTAVSLYLQTTHDTLLQPSVRDHCAL